MGRRSVKENKSIYQECRESLGLSRESASMMMDELISPERIEKIENNKTVTQPLDVLAMSRCYKKPELCNYYCTHECEIGRQNVPEVKVQSLSQTILQAVNSINNLSDRKNRLIEISEDGEITEDEYKDFIEIKKQLDKLASSVSSLQLWIDQKIMDGKLSEDIK